jgi:hypothetical protein
MRATRASDPHPNPAPRRCEYFDKLLYGSMRESGLAEIRMPHASGAALQIVLDYLYTGQMPSLDCDWATMAQVCSLAQQYMLVGGAPAARRTAGSCACPLARAWCRRRRAPPQTPRPPRRHAAPRSPRWCSTWPTSCRWSSRRATWAPA